MSAPPGDPRAFFEAVQRGVRRMAGKALGEALRRWRNTLSADRTALSLDPAAERFLIRYGLLDAGSDKAQRQGGYVALLEAGARATGDAPGVLAAWLRAFAEGEYSWTEKGLCGAQPRCAQCPLCEGCRFLAAGGREERLSGAALAEALAQGEADAAQSLEAAELLAFLVFGAGQGAGAVARAEALLKAHGGLRGLVRASEAELRQHGLAPEARARLRAFVQLTRSWEHEQAPRGKTFARARDFYDHHYRRVRDLKKECFFVFCLDQKNRLLAEEEVSVGSLTEALVHPREVLLPAIRSHAAAIAIVHNHPSGDPVPSRADKALTRRLRDATELVGLRLLDHVVVGDGVYYSFAEQGLL